jgi:hypothetical protein
LALTVADTPIYSNQTRPNPVKRRMLSRPVFA